MTSAAIRILDKVDNLHPDLNDILKEIQNGESYYWSVFEVDGMLNPDQGISLSELKRKVNVPDDGMFVSWDQLILFSEMFFQIYEITVLGSRDPDLLKSKSRKQSVEAACDFVIDFVDCAYWEVFSKDLPFLERLRSKFRMVELLKPSA